MCSSDLDGSFAKGDSVEVSTKAGDVIGCGLVNYSSEKLIRAKGQKLPSEVIHRDNFVKAP